MTEWTVTIFIFLIIGVVSWILCNAAGISDDTIEKMFRQKKEESDHE